MFVELGNELLEPCAKSRDQRLAELCDRLGDIGRLDIRSGVVNLDEVRLREVVSKFASVDADKHASELVAVAKDGFATFGDDGAVPFRLLADPVSAYQYLAPAALEAIGVTRDVRTDALGTDLRSRFPHVPDSVLEPSNLNGLIQGTEALRAAQALEVSLGDQLVADRQALENAFGPRIGGGPQLALTAGEVLACLKTASFSVQWWGWSVCLSRNCGFALSDALLGAVSVPSLVAGLKAWLLSGVAAGIKAAGGPLAIALTLLAVYLGLSIRWNMTPRGVCIQGNWPTPWFGMAVWARGR
jgi:hypothetical protein